MFRKIVLTVFISALSFILLSCHSKPVAHVIKVGAIAGPEAQLMEVAKAVAKDCYNLDVKIVTFNDYNMPNIALSDGSIDANMFQHMPYLRAQIAARKYKIVSAGKVFVYPMGIYSKKFAKLDAVPVGAKIALPNDPSNQSRALLLLQEAGLLTLSVQQGDLVTLQDISNNPLQLQFIPLAAAQLPRALSDVAAAVINTNYAIPAGLSPREALYAEGKFSNYANIVAVRAGEQDSQSVRELVSSLHSLEVIGAAKHIFGDSAVIAWDRRQPIIPCHSR